MEASNTPTIRRLTPSCRHQLSPIAHGVLWLPVALLFAWGVEWHKLDYPKSDQGWSWRDWSKWRRLLVPVLFFVFAISFTTWPPGPLSMTYFMAVIVWIWARMWGLLYRPIEGLGDELNIVYRKLVKGGPPLVALLFLWGAIDASIDLERVTNPYLVRFKKQDTAELRILLRSFDRGLLMKNAFSNRVEFYQWDDLSTIERRPSATTESLLCYLFGYVCRTKQPPTP